MVPTKYSEIATLEAMLLMSASTIEGSNSSDWISGDGNDNTILAGAGDDHIHAPLGDNIINGGSGTDHFVVYEGVRSDYNLSQLSDGSYQLRGPGLNGGTVVNRLIDVERVLFNDGVVSLASNSSPIPSSNENTSNNSAPSSGTDLTGTNAGEWISGTDGNDNINAGGGNDQIHSPAGNNVINGGDGFDTLIVYEGARSQFQISQDTNGIRVTGPGINGQSVSNLLQNVEQIQFNDGSVNLNNSFQPTQQQQPDPEPQSQPEPVAEALPQFETQQNETVQLSNSEAQNDNSANVSEFEREVVRLTNIIRANYGLQQLSISTELSNAADGHSESMAVRDYFGHTDLQGRMPWDRATDAGYEYVTIGENIAAGQLTPEEVVEAWFNSPSHRENLMNPTFNEIGVGYFFLQDDRGSINFNFYWTQLLGSR